MPERKGPTCLPCGLCVLDIGPRDKVVFRIPRSSTESERADIAKALRYAGFDGALIIANEEIEVLVLREVEDA